MEALTLRMLLFLQPARKFGALIDVENEVTAKAMCVATIQLTPEEVQRYNKIPMVDHFEQGEWRCDRTSREMCC
jgi:hypothetical protein